MKSIMAAILQTHTVNRSMYTFKRAYRLLAAYKYYIHYVAEIRSIVLRDTHARCVIRFTYFLVIAMSKALNNRNGGKQTMKSLNFFLSLYNEMHKTEIIKVQTSATEDATTYNAPNTRSNQLLWNTKTEM